MLVHDPLYISQVTVIRSLRRWRAPKQPKYRESALLMWLAADCIKELKLTAKLEAARTQLAEEREASEQLRSSHASSIGRISAKHERCLEKSRESKAVTSFA